MGRFILGQAIVAVFVGTSVAYAADTKATEKPVAVKAVSVVTAKIESDTAVAAKAAQAAKENSVAQAAKEKAAAELKAKSDADEKRKAVAAEAQAKVLADAKAKEIAEAKIKQEAELKAKAAEEAKQKAAKESAEKAAVQAKLDAEKKAKQEAEQKSKSVVVIEKSDSEKALDLAIKKDKEEEKNLYDFAVQASTLRTASQHDTISKLANGKIGRYNKVVSLSYGVATPMLNGKAGKFAQEKRSHYIALVSYKMDEASMALLKDCYDQSIKAMETGAKFSVEAFDLTQHQVFWSHREFFHKYRHQALLRRLKENDEHVKGAQSWRKFDLKSDDDDDEIRRNIYINVDKNKVNCSLK